MPIFEGEVLKQTIGVARKNKIEPAALLAVVEVESAGRSLEVDRRTPSFLFERHVFFKELKKKGDTKLLEKAVAGGYAHSGWRRTTQYKDQNTSANRLALFNKVRAIDEECAIRSCSWGVGQTMGFLAEELSFTNASQMFDYLVSGGIPAQVECMVREIKRKSLVDELNGHKWAAFALVYNGPGYKENSYDTKMASSYEHWRKTKLPDDVEAKPVVAAKESIPDPLTQPNLSTTTPIAIGSVAGAGGAAGLWAYVQTIDIEVILFGIGIAVMVAITLIVIKRRKNKIVPALPVGSLPDVAVVPTNVQVIDGGR